MASFPHLESNNAVSLFLISMSGAPSQLQGLQSGLPSMLQPLRFPIAVVVIRLMVIQNTNRRLLLVEVPRLKVDSPSVCVQNSFVHHLAESWMWEDRMHQFRFGRFQGPGNAVALNQFGNLRTNHMGTQ